jgi:hypothetical protein
VEGGKTDAEKIRRIAKIKHTQNKQREKKKRKNQNQKTGRTNKIQNTMGNKARTRK